MNALWNWLAAHRISLVRWTARGLSLFLFFFWGAFFVEHLSWFTDPSGWPPFFVMAAQTLHGLMLLGLLMGWKWERAGTILLMLSSIPFFLMAAGRSAPAFILMTNFPALLWIYLAVAGWRQARAAAQL